MIFFLNHSKENHVIGFYFMTYKKILLILVLLFLNNCAVSGSAFLGPIYTGAKTGSIYQASLSYGSGKIMNELNQSSKVKSKKTKIFFKNNTTLPDIPYITKDPIIVAFYKVEKIGFSQIIEPEPLP